MQQPSLHRAMQRHCAYQLLSTIFVEGITGEVYATCKDIPSLEPLLPEPYDEDMAGADHHDLLGFNVLPFAGVYLAEDGRPGGQNYQQLNSWYLSHGFNASEMQVPSDHIGTQLAFLAFLLKLEIDGQHRPSEGALVASIQRAQGEFLQTQLLKWSLPFLVAVKTQGNSFYAEAADLTLATVIDHVQDAAVNGDLVHDRPAPPDVLGDHKSGIKQIAEYMARPVFSGLYFSKQDLKLIARQLEIPTGFGDRVQLLTNTFRSAVSYELLPAFLSALKRHAHYFKDEYELLHQAGNERLNYLIVPWVERIEKMLVVFEELERAGISD